jgi:hypothetical protein
MSVSENRQRDDLEEITDLSVPPPFPGVNRFILGAPLQPLERLASFSDKQFEVFVWEWAVDYLAGKYHTVQRRGRAGDKGRDVIAWIDPPDVHPRRWDNYQCKHYKEPLSPSDVCIELGKLCFYTYRGDYTIPDNYFLATHKGVGEKLEKMLEDPRTLGTEVTTTWDTRCKDKITSVPISLEGGFRDYVRDFDFSIVHAICPEQLLVEHSKTRYHALIFGTFVRPRPQPPAPPPVLQRVEARYVEQIYEAFADCLNRPVTNEADFKDRHDMCQDFRRARVGFYSTESLKEFARDNLPDDTYFTDLKSQFHSGIGIVVDANHTDGYARMIETTKLALQLQINASVLKEELRPDDRIGMCHHLANEDAITWVRE